MGLDVPPEAQDTESQEHARWLESVFNFQFFGTPTKHIAITCDVFEPDGSLSPHPTKYIEYEI